MRAVHRLFHFAAIGALIGAALPDEVRAQAPKTHQIGEVRTVSKSGETRGVSRGARARRRVAVPRDSKALRIEVSVADRRLWAIMGSDTLLAAPAAIAEGSTFRYAGRTWKFETPSGVHTVLRKETDPVWRPPMWHYAEVAHQYGLKLAELPARRPVRLKDGSLLTVRDSLVGVVFPDSGNVFEPLPIDEEIVFDETLFIPPIGTKNRALDGELGRFRLDLGDGYQIHGTPREETVGTATTHGCVRLRDEDLAWLYENVPVGTKVYVR
jgi:hypothetical protein